MNETDDKNIRREPNHFDKRCESCGEPMIGIIIGAQVPARTVGSCCGGQPLSAEQRLRMTHEQG